jgi:hypothetical protein
MGNHNLLSDDDFFEKSKPGKKDPKEKKDEVYSEEEEFLKSKPKDQDTLDLEDIESSLQERPDAGSEKDFDLFEDDADLKKPAETAKKQPEPQPAPDKPKPQKDLQYQKVYFDADEKQQGISYTPFIVIVLIIVLVGVGGYYGYKWYMGRKSAVQQPVVTEPQETIPTEPVEEVPKVNQQKLNFLANMAGRTSRELNSVVGVVGASTSGIKLSSILLYDSDLTFEVFGNSREDLARMNIKLKEKFKNQEFKIVSSSQRPGEKGGILGVYTASLASGSGENKQMGPTFKNGSEADKWLQDVFKQNKLKYNGVKTRKSNTTDMFTVYEIETTASGSITACTAAINKIASAGTNLQIHKLTCNAVDQKDFSTGKYQLKLVLKIYA